MDHVSKHGAFLRPVLARARPAPRHAPSRSVHVCRGQLQPYRRVRLAGKRAIASGSSLRRRDAPQRPRREAGRERRGAAQLGRRPAGGLAADLGLEQAAQRCCASARRGPAPQRRLEAAAPAPEVDRRARLLDHLLGRLAGLDQAGQLVAGGRSGWRARAAGGPAPGPRRAGGSRQRSTSAAWPSAAAWTRSSRPSAALSPTTAATSCRVTGRGARSPAAGAR